MANKTRWGEHEPVNIPGWIQVGTRLGGGYKYGTWVKQLDDGLTLSIQQGDESGRYWLQIGNCYHGSHSTPQKAAQKAAKVCEALPNE
jgi:hypothetical protein